MAEHAITSFKDRLMALRARHQKHVQRAGQTAQMVGQSILSGASAFAVGAANVKFGTDELAYPNLGMAKIGPVPMSLALGAAGIAAAMYGHGESWAPFAEAAGSGALAEYSGVQGRRMAIDWKKAQK